MRSNALLAAATSSFVTLALAGCASGDADRPTVPTAQGAPAGVTTKDGGAQGRGDDLAAYVESQRRWVTCMRDSGIDIPDADSKGRVDLAGQGPALKTNPKFIRASKSCSYLMGQVPQGFEEANEPLLSPSQIKIKQDYAKCMQQGGAPDFPDPGVDGYGDGDNSGQPEWDQTSAGARRATRICASIIGDSPEQHVGKG